MPRYGWLQRNALRNRRSRPAPRGAACASAYPIPRTMIANAVSRRLPAKPTPTAPMPPASSERYGEATNIRAFDGDPAALTEMDALVAYLQILGKLTDAAHRQTASSKE